MIEMLLCSMKDKNDDYDAIKWENIPFGSSAPRGVYAMGFTGVGDDIYCFGGNSTSAPTLTNVPFWKFNTVTKTYTPLPTPNISGARYDAGLAYSSGILVTIGGNPINRSIRYYNIAAGAWSNTTLQYPISAFSVALVTRGTRVYGVGGNNNSGGINTVCYIDCTTLAITQVANLPVTLFGGTAFGLDNQDEFYYYGGVANGVYSSRLFKYTISTNAWVELDAGPIAETNIRSTVVNGVAYIVGFSEAKYKSYTLAYDGSTWSVLKPATPAPGQRWSMGVASSSDSVYIFGGYNGTMLTDMWRYTPPV